MSPRLLLVCNSNGGVLQECLRHDFFRKAVAGIASDRDCGLVHADVTTDLPCHILDADNEADFSVRLADLAHSISATHLITCGLTRILTEPVLSRHTNHILNSHFSLLPAFPGRAGSDWTTSELAPRQIFERALLYGVRFTGNTIHTIDRSIDGGKPVIQSVLTIPFSPDPEQLRHELFLQEVRCMLQVVRWLVDGRLRLSTPYPTVSDARFDHTGYSPNLDPVIATATLPANRTGS